MIINPTKKALPIFNKLVKVEDGNEAKVVATANPFFSWHANYYNVNRKKVLILVNDATYATVVLYDINANNKGNLVTYIEEGIKRAFKIAGISDTDIKKYFAVAGGLEVNAGFNRQVTGIITNMILISEEGWLINPQELLQVNLMDRLMQIPYKQKNYIYAKEAVKEAFKAELKIVVPDTTELEKNAYKLNKTWRDYHQWDKYEDDQSLLEDYEMRYEKVADEVKANNKILLAEFKRYLTESEGLSKKVVNKHADNVLLYVDEFSLYYTIKTPLKVADDVMEFLMDWYPRKIAYGPAEVKSAGTSMKKFLKFMEMAGEISKSDVEDGKEMISNGVELGVEHMQVIDNMTDFW
ncbi:hypothetical protein EQG49_07065 [Periweissella cryptocerci]|uniref:DUF6933 domain-containing protein n=1 Tax=Periweissella cryptocerci TaxID=2506420 RepID=A0A4V1AIP6_9LACO|nr:hypothetical protein [Periweissella cryptocerci]QBO36235.1 hypothetical protein EQG49_07065 [Periweissella cryptocerci]